MRLGHKNKMMPIPQTPSVEFEISLEVPPVSLTTGTRKIVQKVIYGIPERPSRKFLREKNQEALLL